MYKFQNIRCSKKCDKQTLRQTDSKRSSAPKDCGYFRNIKIKLNYDGFPLTRSTVFLEVKNEIMQNYSRKNRTKNLSWNP